MTVRPIGPVGPVVRRAPTREASTDELACPHRGSFVERIRAVAGRVGP